MQNLSSTRLKGPRNGIALSCLLAMALWLMPMNVKAQLSSNPDKFLGNITTGYQVDYGNEKFYTLWNQITPENESKWSSIEGSRRGSFSWGGCDNAYNYAKNHNFPFKFHCLIWGAQYPNWLNNLSTSEQYKAIEEWMDAIKAHYPNLPLIDVVNEAVPGHQPAPYKAALGGDGKTGYDWIIKAFEMAHERWPDAILIYNDYNTFQWQRSEFINLVRILRDAGAPIDAYGCQSHDLTDMSVSNFKSAMTEIQNALKMPMYSTEYDIGTSDDALQLQRYKEQIPYMWEADYCAGITLWGYIYGRTWTTDGNSGIIRDGKDRPAMTWLREYMKTDAAKNAKSPFPGMVKEASVYVKPAALSVTINEEVPITVRARLKTKTIDHVDLYVKNQLVATMTEAPYTTTYVPEALGKYDLKAVVVATDGSQYERLSGFTAYRPRSPYKGGTELPGTLEAENFDTGAEGITYHDTDTKNEGTNSYRTDGGGVDIVSCTGGYAIGYTSSGEWLEYTVDVKEAGIYSYDATVSSGVTSSSFSLSLNTNDGLVKLTDAVAVPCVTANNWDTYRVVHGRLLVPLEAGKQIIRVNITGSSCNIDKFVFKHVEVDDNMAVSVIADPSPATVGENTTITVNASSATSTIDNVKIYLEGVLLKTLTSEPFETTYKPTAKGTVNFFVIATDAEGKQSPIVRKTITVNNKRSAFRTVVNLPGVIQAENFDKGGEGLTFHDSDSNDEGGTNYRTDNEGVDIVSGGSGYVIGYTAADEWLEYTVNFTQPGKYSYEATVSSGATGSGFTIGLVENGKVTNLAKVNVPQTASNSWDTYKVVSGNLNKEFETGQQILRITINGAYCNIDKIELKSTNGIDDATAVQQVNGPSYNLMGMKVGADYKGIVIKNGKKYLKK
ncbi:MAG: endo-1,4-beta-xylanase [Prevotella sp.]|nr:endo-1,4-beta-xylanase [Prevotella sp.]